jgi:hypothetical protein
MCRRREKNPGLKRTAVDDLSDSPKLPSFEFLVLCLVIVAAFCNVSVFYGFYHYLGTSGIPVAGRGFLVGLGPMSALILRLFVLPWLHVRNVFSVMEASLVLLTVASCCHTLPDACHGSGAPTNKFG